MNILNQDKSNKKLCVLIWSSTLKANIVHQIQTRPWNSNISWNNGRQWETQSTNKSIRIRIGHFAIHIFTILILFAIFRRDRYIQFACQNLLIYQLQGNIYRCLIHHETSVILFIINKQVLKCWKEWVIGSFKFSIVSAHLQMFANFSHMQCILDNIFATVNGCGEFNGNVISASNKSTVDNLSTFFIA